MLGAKIVLLVTQETVQIQMRHNADDAEQVKQAREKVRLRAVDVSWEHMAVALAFATRVLLVFTKTAKVKQNVIIVRQIPT